MLVMRSHCLRRFYESMPMQVLERHIDWFIANERAR